MGSFGNEPPAPLPTPPDFPPLNFADQTPPKPVLTADTSCAAPPPDLHFDFPIETLNETYRWVTSALCNLGVPGWAQSILGGLVMCVPVAVDVTLGVVTFLIRPLITTLLTPIFAGLSDVRTDLQKSVGPLAIISISELFGGTVNESHFDPNSTALTAQGRAEQIGAAFHEQFIKRFAGEGDVTPEKGKLAAEVFTGQIAGFGAATGTLGVLGELVPWLHLDRLGEIGAQVGAGLGLGRMNRVLMRPILTTLMATPYQHWLNQKYKPTEFTVGEILNPYTGTTLPDQAFYKATAILGYSNDKATALRNLHRKKITPAEVMLLDVFNVLPPEKIAEVSKDAGIDDNYSAMLSLLYGLNRATARVELFVTALETAFVQGEIDQLEFESALNSLPMAPAERDVVKHTATFRQALHGKHKRIAEHQIEYAFENGLVDLAELEAYYAQQGFDDDSVTILTQIVLFRTKKLADAARAKADRLAAKAVATAAKTAAKAIPPAAPGSPPATP